MEKLIAIYGGTDLSEVTAAFVEKLSYAILKNIESSVIVNGGFEYKTDKEGERVTGISTDYSAYKGAQKYAAEKKISLKKYLKTWIPEPEKDRNKEHVKRFTEGDWEIVKGRSAQARRFDMVNRVNAVVTVRGKKHTAMVLDFAIITGKPFLPLAFTGEDSEEYWGDNKQLIRDTFDISDINFINKLEKFNPSLASEKETDDFIDDITATIKKGLKKACLILREYNKHSDEFYQQSVKPAIIEKGFTPIDIRDEINKGNILSIFINKLETSDAILADITEANPNVMYEIGQAHARGYYVILFSRKKIDESLGQKVPFYLLMDKIEHDDAMTTEGTKAIIERIQEHLSQNKRIL